MGRICSSKLFWLLIFVCVATVEAFSQCPMCKLAAESNLQGGGTAGKGLNTGILYLLAAPYLLVFSMYKLWKRNRNKIQSA